MKASDMRKWYILTVWRQFYSSADKGGTVAKQCSALQRSAGWVFSLTSFGKIALELQDA